MEATEAAMALPADALLALCRGQQLGDALVHLCELLRQLRDHGVEVRGRRCEPLIELHDDRAQFGVLLIRAVKLQHALQEHDDAAVKRYA